MWWLMIYIYSTKSWIRVRLILSPIPTHLQPWDYRFWQVFPFSFNFIGQLWGGFLFSRPLTYIVCERWFGTHLKCCLCSLAPNKSSGFNNRPKLSYVLNICYLSYYNMWILYKCGTNLLWEWGYIICFFHIIVYESHIIVIPTHHKSDDIISIT